MNQCGDLDKKVFAWEEDTLCGRLLDCYLMLALNGMITEAEDIKIRNRLNKEILRQAKAKKR